MQRMLSLSSVNHHLMCVLCGGYLIDATTISECLHSFCKTCIVRYLETSYNCPVCDTEVHKTKPLSNIRSDPTLQEIVLKLVPNLYDKEEERRREFMKSQTIANELDEPGPSCAKKQTDNQATEKVFVTLKYFRGPSRYQRHVKVLSLFPTRYLCCPRNMPVKILKKFIKIKFDIPCDWQVEVWKTDESLLDQLLLTDVIRIFGAFRERTPLELQFSVTPPPRPDNKPPEKEQPMRMQLSTPRVTPPPPPATNNETTDHLSDETMTEPNEPTDHQESSTEGPTASATSMAEDTIMTSTDNLPCPVVTLSSDVKTNPIEPFPVNTPLLSSLKLIEALNSATSTSITTHLSSTNLEADIPSTVANDIETSPVIALNPILTDDLGSSAAIINKEEIHRVANDEQILSNDAIGVEPSPTVAEDVPTVADDPSKKDEHLFSNQEENQVQNNAESI